MQNELDVRKYLSLLNRYKRLFAVTALALMTCAVVACYLLPKKYEARSTVFIEKNVISDLVKGIAITPSMEDAIKVLTYAITSRTLVQKVMDELDMGAGLKSEMEKERLYAQVQKNIDVKVKDKNLFIITYTDQNPRVARDFVNTLVRRYIEENVSSKREESYGAIKFLSDQMVTFKEKLDKADAELNRFKAEKGGIIAIDEGKLFEEINIAKQKLYDLELRRRHLEGLKPVTRRASDPLQVKLSSLQKHLEELRSAYTDNYPEVQRTMSEIETLKEQMGRRKPGVEVATDPQELERADAELQALRVSEAGLRRYIASNQSLLQSIPSAKAGMDQLELERKSQKELYDQLLARQGQSEVSKQMEVQDKTTNFRIVDPAILPAAPVSPNRVKIILMGIVAGLAAAGGLILALDRLRPTVRDADTLKAMGYQIMAIVPRIRVEDEIRREKRRDKRLFACAGAYFSIIILCLVSEAVRYSLVDRVVARIVGG